RIGTAPAPMLGGWRRAWHRRLMSRAATVVCVAEAVRVEAVERLGVDPARTVTGPHPGAPARGGATDPAAARPAGRGALGGPPAAVAVLSLGALSWEKDPLGALAVSAPLLGGPQPVVHLFVGAGPLRDGLAAAALAAPGPVVVAGGRTDVDRVLAASD